MSEDRPVAVNKTARPTGPQSGPVASLTPKEVFDILRRHIFLIVFLTLLGLAAGGGTWKLLQMYFPRFTARTYIQVLPPVEKDPMTISTVQLQKDILFEHRQSIANLIKQQRTLEDLLARDAVKETKWFEQWGGDRRRSLKYLQKHFGAYAQRDSTFVEISMTCGAAKEAADIVNEMLTLFLAQQGTSEQREISNRLQRLEEQRIRVQGELDAANKGLDDIRAAYDLTDLERPAGRYFQHTITLKLNALELQRNELDLAIRQLQADIGNLQELASGPIAEQVEFVIEKDPVMLDLARQLGEEGASGAMALGLGSAVLALLFVSPFMAGAMVTIPGQYLRRVCRARPSVLPASVISGRDNDGFPIGVISGHLPSLRSILSRQALGHHKRHGIPGIVNADKHQKQRGATDSEKRWPRSARQHDGRDEHCRVREERKHRVPEPVLQHWLVPTLTTCPTDNDHGIDNAGAAAGTKDHRYARQPVPGRADERRYQQRRTEMHDRWRTKRADRPTKAASASLGDERDHHKHQSRERRCRRADDNVKAFPPRK